MTNEEIIHQLETGLNLDKMIFIHQHGHGTLGWGETKEKAFQDATSICSGLTWEQIKHDTDTDGECYWSTNPETKNYRRA